jgi:1-deoxy-D-xylulose-5-phosphate synthase
VINCRFIKPFDRPLLDEVSETTPLIVTAEENVLSGGFGSRVRAVLDERGRAGHALECIGLPDQFIEHGSQSILRSKYGLSADAIVQRILSRLEVTRGPLESPGPEVTGSASMGA